LQIGGGGIRVFRPARYEGDNNMAKTELKNDASNAITITLDGDTGNIHAGGHGQQGGLSLSDKND
jgi:hypothetical protein